MWIECSVANPLRRAVHDVCGVTVTWVGTRRLPASGGWPEDLSGGRRWTLTPHHEHRQGQDQGDGRGGER